MSDFDEPPEEASLPADKSGGDQALPDSGISRRSTEENVVPLVPFYQNGLQGSGIAILDSTKSENNDELNPDQAVLDHPEWDVQTMLQAATFDTVVPEAILATRGTTFQTMNFNGLFSLDPYSLELYFKFMNGQVDADGRVIEKDDENTMADAIEKGAENAERQREIEETFSESEIDAMPWVGDPNAVWDMDGISASRSTWLNAAKAVRKKLPQIAKDNNWTEAEQTDQQYWVSQYEARIKANDREGAAEIASQHLKPETKQALDVEASKDISVGRNTGVSSDLFRAGNSAAANAAVSSDARADILGAASAQLPSATPSSESASPIVVSAQASPMEPASKVEPVTASPSALSNPPNIELTGTYNTVAAAPPARSPVSPEPVELANAAPVRTSPAPLDSGFSI